jgi:hypothetical protein
MRTWMDPALVIVMCKGLRHRRSANDEVPI